MKKIIFIIILFLLAFSTVGFSHQSITVNNLTIEITTEPNEPPVSGETSIINFDVTKDDGEHPNHTDIYFNLSKDGNPVVTNYYIHSHLGTPSYAQYFETFGTYNLTMFLRSSDHYNDSFKFQPFKTQFNIIVNPNTSKPKTSDNLIYIIIAIVIITASLVVIFRKKIFR